MKVVLPFRSEFGIRIWRFVPAVHGMDGERVVYCEEGEEALFPSAAEHVVVGRAQDSLRRNSYAKDAEFVAACRRDARRMFPGAQIVEPTEKWPRKRFIPQPVERYGIDCDVVVCPRRREYGAGKNWPCWPALTERLTAEGLRVFAAGAADSSYDVPCPRSWDAPRTLDATLEAMHAARLVVATDAGLAHLAVLAGRPLLMITHADGLVAPGPVINENGRKIADQYWPVHMHRYREANHTGSPIVKLHRAWFDLDRVVTRALEMLVRGPETAKEA